MTFYSKACLCQRKGSKAEVAVCGAKFLGFVLLFFGIFWKSILGRKHPFKEWVADKEGSYRNNLGRSRVVDNLKQSRSCFLVLGGVQKHIGIGTLVFLGPDKWRLIYRSCFLLEIINIFSLAMLIGSLFFFCFPPPDS